MIVNRLMRNRVTRYSVVGGAFILSAVMSVTANDKTDDEFPPLTPELAEGRQLWLDNCQTCHAYGIAGAPIPRIPKQWKHRLQSPLPLLYEHAIEGFYGDSDTHMPARGGNPALTDAEVMAAVDYMVALAKHYLSTTED